jgi:hypothetical protein
MGTKPEAPMPETLLAIEKANAATNLNEHTVELTLDFKLSDAAIAEIKLLEQCSILAEHRLGEFRVG